MDTQGLTTGEEPPHPTSKSGKERGMEELTDDMAQLRVTDTPKDTVRGKEREDDGVVFECEARFFRCDPVSSLWQEMGDGRVLLVRDGPLHSPSVVMCDQQGKELTRHPLGLSVKLQPLTKPNQWSWSCLGQVVAVQLLDDTMASAFTLHFAALSTEIVSGPSRQAEGGDRGRGPLTLSQQSSLDTLEGEGDDEVEPDPDTQRRMDTLQKVMATSYKNATSAQRLTKELLAVYASGLFVVDLVEDNLFGWHVQLTESEFAEDSAIRNDLVQVAKTTGGEAHILLCIKFPSDYPFHAPFVYIIRPQVQCKYVFDGAICMELLIDWNPAHSSVESILLQICSTLGEGGARLATVVGREGGSQAGGSNGEVSGDYSPERAQRAYDHLKSYHDQLGWTHRRLLDA